MFLRYGILADAVLPAGSGKWNVIGSMNVIWSASWPAVHHRMGLLLRIEGDPQETGKHELEIDFVDEMGQRITGPPKANFELGSPTIPGFPIGGEIGVEINQLKIPGPGNYDFVIRIDGRYIDSVPLYARDATDRESAQ